MTIKFNELLAKDLAEYLWKNQDWFLQYDDWSGDISYLSQDQLQEAIEGFFKHEQTAALLKSK